MVGPLGIMFWTNVVTAAAYYVLTVQLIFVARSTKLLSLFSASNIQKEPKKQELLYLLIATVTLFASFIAMCGNTHLMRIMRFFYPHHEAVKTLEVIIMVICAIVSMLTAVAGFKIFPIILEILSKFELSSEGHFQLAENYLVEVVEMIKESIMVLSEDLKVLRCNEASKILFGKNCTGQKFTDFIHPKDAPMFNDTVLRVMESYNFTPATVELRVARGPVIVLPPLGPSPTIRGKSMPNMSPSSRRRASHNRVYCADDSASRRSLASGSPVSRSPSLSSSRIGSSADEEYMWIECTLCKGKRLNASLEFEYDLKMACRNIDDRKKRALYQTLIEGTEERGRINEAKMRYVSCIAHDLKTPLQSFCFTLDLLQQTSLCKEQRELTEQANVAVDLMKLTISQTMDISKALTGAKLMPRRTTLYLSSVLKRVMIIINGFGKQVPVSVRMAPDICDEIITDEEWLWQMLLNLLTNACKYTDKGGITVRVSVQRDNQGDQLIGNDTERYSRVPVLTVPSYCSEMLLCEVIDTGVGISPDKIAHVFDAFAQVQDGQVTGTGLGLFGVRARAEGLSGSCGARHNTESSTGTGTVLWFAIPYVPDTGTLTPAAVSTKHVKRSATARVGADTGFHVNPASQANPMNPVKRADSLTVESFHMDADPLPPLEAPSADGTVGSESTVREHYAVPTDDYAARTEEQIRRRKLTAMVVEDTHTVRKLMEKLLLRMGFAEVRCYENGSKGLDAMMAGTVDIVFSDVQMPIMTGPEMVSRFRRFEADCLFAGTRAERQLVVAVTANGSDSGGCGEQGFDEICPKPLNKMDIYRIVNNYISSQ